MKSLIKLLKKLFHQLVGAANDTYEKNYDPIRAMKQAIRDIDTECEKLEQRYINVSQKTKSAKRLIKEKEDLANTIRGRAKQYKDSGELDKAQKYAERLVRINDWLERYQMSQSDVQKHKTVIKEVHDGLEFKKEELELELELMEASQEMSEFRIDKIKNVDGFSNVTSIESIIKEAREKVAETEDRAESYEEANEVFRKDDSDEVTAMSQKARDVLDQL